MTPAEILRAAAARLREVAAQATPGPWTSVDDRCAQLRAEGRRAVTFTPIKERLLHGGIQRLYRFDNGYGASVVRHDFSYGTELAVIRWTGDTCELCYDTPITDDVIGHLDEAGIAEVLQLISELPKDGRILELPKGRQVLELPKGGDR